MGLFCQKFKDGHDGGATAPGGGEGAYPILSGTEVADLVLLLEEYLQHRETFSEDAVLEQLKSYTTKTVRPLCSALEYMRDTSVFWGTYKEWNDLAYLLLHAQAEQYAYFPDAIKRMGEAGVDSLIEKVCGIADVFAPQAVNIEGGVDGPRNE